MSLVAIWFLSLRNATDFDYGWHLENGRHLSDGILLGGADVYSWTAAGAPWVAHEWLTEVGIAILHDGPGPTAVSFAAAIIVACAFLLVAVSISTRLRSSGNDRDDRPRVCVHARLDGARPQLLELLYLAATLIVVDRWWSRRLTRTWLWVLTAVGAMIWTNTHGSFVLLAGVLSITFVSAVLGGERRWPEAAVAVALSLVVPLLNPWGLALYGFVIQKSDQRGHRKPRPGIPVPEPARGPLYPVYGRPGRRGGGRDLRHDPS